MDFKNIQDAKGLKGKRVLLRSGLNVHIKDRVIVDDFRLLRALPTITFLRQLGARVIVVSHIDEKEGGSLEPVAEYFEGFFPLTFIKNFAREDTKVKVENMQDGDVVLFENLRIEDGEEKNDSRFAERLASYADIFVNDAFSVSHREHASIVGVPKLLPSYAGLQFQSEVDHLSTAFKPESPALLILGGAKPETKIPLITRFVDIADTIFVAGVTANVLFKAQGFEVGQSIISKENIDVSKILSAKNIFLPEDVLIARSYGSLIKSPQAVAKDELIADVGPATMMKLDELIKKAEFVIWNGPLGIYEKGFTENTKELARMLAASKARKIVGGGDTFTVIGALRYEEKFDFISTAGGAMIQFLSDQTLPGIKALEASL